MLCELLSPNKILVYMPDKLWVQNCLYTHTSLYGLLLRLWGCAGLDRFSAGGFEGEES